MKKIFLVISGLIIIISSISCNKHNNKIGFLLPNLSDARYLKDRDFFSNKVSQLGGEVTFGDAQNNSNTQMEQATQMIKDGVSIIVIVAVNQNLAAAIVRLAHNNGVKVIAYERLIQNCQLDYFIGFDHYLVGKQQANYAIQSKPTGNYIIIGGDKSDKNAELIEKGQQEVLQPLINQGKIKVLYHAFIENWSERDANWELSRALNLLMKKVDVVLSANDGMAGGVIEALEKYQPGYSVLVTGLDADLIACRRIAEGTQSMTVYKPFKIQAEIAAEIAIKLSQNTPIINSGQTTFNGLIKVPTIYLVSIPVDILNMESTIIADKFYSKKEIFVNGNNKKK